jgi:ubiquinol-cytochrome c reductase core subunit 2
LGASHIIRVAAGLTTKNATQFGIMRNIQQAGGSLSVVSDREIVAYTIEMTRDNLETALQYLEGAVTGQIFKPWEIQDITPRVKIDLANVSDQVCAVELLHRAAYRNGLGNSIFCPSHKVGKLSSETLQHFFENNFTASRAAVSGVNVDHQMLVGFAQSLKLGSGNGTDSQSKFYGGVDARCEKGGRTASVAVGTNGGSWANLKEGLAFKILQNAAGVCPNTKRGSSAGVLVKAIQGAAPNSAASALNACYTDNGLFGFIVSGPAKEVGNAVEVGIKALKSASISDDDVNRGKAQLKSEIAFTYDSDATLVEALAGQSAALGSPINLKSALEAVDSVSSSDVKAVRSNIITICIKIIIQSFFFAGRSQTFRTCINWRLRKLEQCSICSRFLN